VIASGFTIAMANRAHANALAGIEYAGIEAYAFDPYSYDMPYFVPGIIITASSDVAIKSHVSGDGVVSYGSVGFGPYDAGIHNVSAAVSGEGFASVTVTDLYKLTITNNSGYAFGFPSLYVWFAAFNPGGDNIGASVTVPKLERAMYSSSIVGGGESVFVAYAFGDTAVPDCGNNWGSFNPFSGSGIACGMGAPDDNSSDSFLGPIGVGQTITATFIISVTVEASAIPEPVGASLFGIALTALAVTERKRRLS
jgi:hypothetical protein